MKHTSNTTKATLQPYSPSELREIAENIREYQIASVRDYAYINERGACVMIRGEQREIHKAQLWNIQKDLYERGAHKPQAEAQFTLKTIGTTFCS
jgi:hypothetical protein